MRENTSRAGVRAAHRRQLLAQRIILLGLGFLIGAALAHTISTGRFDGLSLLGVMATALAVAWCLHLLALTRSHQ